MRLCYLGKGGVESIFKGSPSSSNEIIDRVLKLNRFEYRQKWKFLDDADWTAIDELAEDYGRTRGEIEEAIRFERHAEAA